MAGTVAFISCPCHLPLTLPLLLAITSGTALGAWLERSTTTIYVVSTILFLGGLALAGKWLFSDSAETCCVDTKDQRREWS